MEEDSSENEMEGWLPAPRLIKSSRSPEDRMATSLSALWKTGNNEDRNGT